MKTVTQNKKIVFGLTSLVYPAGNKHILSRGASILVIIFSIVCCSSLRAWDSQAPWALGYSISDSYTYQYWSKSAEFTIAAPGSGIQQLPFIEHIEGFESLPPSTLVSYSQHSDAFTNTALSTGAEGLRVATDLSQSSPWSANLTSSSNFVGPLPGDNHNTYLTCITKIVGGDKDGWLFALNYQTNYIDSHNSKTFGWVSSDGGFHWQAAFGVFNTTETQVASYPSASASQSKMQFHRSVWCEWEYISAISDYGPVLYATMYGKFSGDSYFRTLLVKSTDIGQTWTKVSTVASGGRNYGEPVSTQTSDGALLVVMRTDPSPGNQSTGCPLYQVLSSDGGLTWNTPALLPGLSASETYGAVDPDLIRTSDGRLLLSCSSGLRTLTIADAIKIFISEDGTGKSWDYKIGSVISSASGYSGIREVEPNKFLLITDAGTWNGGSGIQTIKGRYLRLERKFGIDFDSDSPGGPPSFFKVLGANVSVYPEEYGNSLLLEDTSNTVQTACVYQSIVASAVVKLEFWVKIATSTALVSLTSTDTGANSAFELGFPADGSVTYYNGTAWTQALPAGTLSPGNWNGVQLITGGAGKAFLTANGGYAVLGASSATRVIDRVRFASYGTASVGGKFWIDDVTLKPTDTWDRFTEVWPANGQNVANLAPLDMTSSGVQFGVWWMFDQSTFVPTVKFYDYSQTLFSTATKMASPNHTKSLQFDILPDTLTASMGGIAISLNSGGDANTNAVFFLNIFPNGSLGWSSGSGYTEIMPPGSVTIGAWNHFEFQASTITGQCVVSKSDASYSNWVSGTALKYSAAPTIDRLRFATGSTEATGLLFYVKNIWIQ